jgi:hypothetical protein
LNSSAAACANGKTVDEPSIRIWPGELLGGRLRAVRGVPLVVVAACRDHERQRRQHGEHQQ